MSSMFESQPNVVVFQDDILLFTNDELAHNKLIEEFLEILRNRGVPLRLDKCIFKVKEIEYLGHMLTENGVKTKPGLVKSIVAAPARSTKNNYFHF